MGIDVTIGVISFNRKKYMKSLLESLRVFKDDERFQVVVVDNGSSEEGLRDMLIESNVIDDLHLGESIDWINGEYVAKNKMIELTKGDTLLSLQDDRQFIGTPDYLKKYSDDLLEMQIPMLKLDTVRKVTLASKLMTENTFQSSKTGCKYWLTKDNHVGTTGLFLVKVLRQMGPYPVDWPVDKEYWGKSEDYFDKKIKEAFPDQHVTAFGHVPLVASIWNDPRGGVSFIRNGTRYGVYESAPDESGLYYKMLTDSDISKQMENPAPASFVDVCDSLGWNYSIDKTTGDQVKYDQKLVMAEGPSSTLFSSTTQEDKSVTSDDEWVEEWLES